LRKLISSLLFVTILGLVASFIGCKDRFTWFLETAPVIIGWPLLIYLDRKYRVSNLLLVFVFLHGLILMLGGHYTYAEVPLGFWAQEWFGFARNHYDRIGHLAQGFFPAVIFREVYIRKAKFPRGVWLSFVVVTGCMAFSAFYEFIEWWTALVSGEGADAFLGTQGDVWDTQWDMFLCTVGALVSIVTLSKVHDRSLIDLTTNN
jgi:putative membrane protein